MTALVGNITGEEELVVVDTVVDTVVEIAALTTGEIPVMWTITGRPIAGIIILMAIIIIIPTTGVGTDIIATIGSRKQNI